MSANLVSIIVPCYNQEAYLNATLNSVFNQIHQNWECILVNDGSTDGTQSIIDEWVRKDTRFVAIQQVNGGLSNARNSGLKKAKGDWIQFLDADDFLDKQKLSLSIEKTEDIVLTDFLMFKDKPSQTHKAFCDLKNKQFSFNSILLDWDVNYSIPIHCGMFKKTLLNNVLFNEAVKAKEDWIFWLTIFKNTPSVAFLPKPLALYRTHESNMTKKEVFMFKNVIVAYRAIFENVLADDNHKTLFFNRVVNEYSDFKTRYFDLIHSDNVVEELAGYKKARDKYYNVWYRKYFYKFFKPKKFNKLYC